MNLTRHISAHPRRASLALILCACVLLVIGVAGLGQGVWIQAKAIAGERLLQRAFERGQITGVPVAPWPWADIRVLARLSVPELGETAMVLASADGEALAFGAGHLPLSAPPGGPGTSVIAGHRDSHFAFLGRLRPGHKVVLENVAGGRSRYRVTGSLVVPWDAAPIDVASAGRHLVLVTCWPLDGLLPGPDRYLVVADAVDA